MMHGQKTPVAFDHPVTLVGAGALTREMVDEARAHAPELVAADSAADRLDSWGLCPAAVIGDMDSISDPDSWKTRTRFVHLSEQDSTDFEKCLYATQAPLYIGAGFTGRRVDHLLAALHAMLARSDKTVILLGEDEAISLVPPKRPLILKLARGARVSLFPLVATTCTHSRGLRWPVEGLTLAPGRRIGTSNMASEGAVEVAFDRPGTVVMVERRHLPAMVRAVA